MKKSLISTIFGIVILLSIFSISATQTKGISIQGLERPVANFSVHIYLPYQTGMQNDFSDLRFKEGTTNLSFYLENYSSGTYANVWVKIPSMTTTQKNITLEYNNGLSSASDFNNAFMFSDDFSSDTSANYQANAHASFVISGGVMNFTNIDGDTGFVYPKLAYQRKPSNYTIEARIKLDSPLDNSMAYGICGYSADLVSNNVGECFLLINSPTKYRSITRMGVAHADLQQITDFDFTRSEYHYQFFTLINSDNNNKLSTYINDSYISKRNINDPSYTAGYYGLGSALGSGSFLVDWVRVRPYSDYMPNITLYSTALGIPDIQFVNPTYENLDQFNRRNIIVNVTSNLAGLDNLTIYLYNSSNFLLFTQSSASSPLYHNFTVSSDGIYKFNATACNIDNCNSTETRTVLLDTFNPITDIIYPEDNDYYSSKPTYLNITATNTGTIAKCWFSINNGLTNVTFPSCIEGTNNIFSGFDTYLTEGKNSVSVWANDTVSLYSTAHTHNFTVDTTNPTVQYDFPTPADSSYLPIDSFIANVSADDLNFANLTIILANFSGDIITVATTDKRIVYNFSGLPNTAYTLTAIAYDLAGNSFSPVPLIIFVNATPPIPPTPPTPKTPSEFSSTMTELGLGIGGLFGGFLSIIAKFILLIAVVGIIVVIFYRVFELILSSIKYRGHR